MAATPAPSMAAITASMAATPAPLTAANAPTPERPPAFPGDLVAGKYIIERMVAQGTTGLVFAAHHAKLGEKVALKFLRPELAYLPSLRARFECEARAAARLKGEHIVRILDVEATPDGLPCIVMEYLEGRDLKKLLAADGPLSVREAADCVAQACVGLAELHAMGLVHRDLRPSNIFLTRRSDGSPLVKVLDFGISKTVSEVDERTDLTWMDRLQGCAKYISPEQARCAWRVDMRADVWSLGVILYELVTGELPFRGSSMGELLSAILGEAPRPLPQVGREHPAELQKVLSRCLEKDAAQRMPTVVQLGLALSPWVRSDTCVALSRLAGEPRPRSIGTEASTVGPPSGPRSGRAHHASESAPLVASWAERTSEWPAISYDFLRGKRTAVRGIIAVVAGCGLLASVALCRSHGRAIAGKAATVPPPPRASISAAAPPDTTALVVGPSCPIQDDKPAALGPPLPASNDKPTATPSAAATDDTRTPIETPGAAAIDGKSAPAGSAGATAAPTDTAAAAIQAVNDGRGAETSSPGVSAASAEPPTSSLAPARRVAIAPARSRPTPSVRTRIPTPTPGPTASSAGTASANFRSLFEDRR
jgi:eukaryotic-like serine/threonine-protein kinase